MLRVSSLFITPLLALTASACSAASPPRPLSEGPPARVAVAPAHEEPLAVTHFASGTVRGRNTAVLTSKTMGYVRSVLVHPGDAVTSGQVLAELEANDLRASVRWRGAVAQQEMARARLRAVTAGIDEAKAGLAESQATLGYSRIVAPFAGRVLERRVDPGALAAPGTPLLVVADEGVLRVEAAVEETRASDVKIGDLATIQIDTLPAPIIGMVSEIGPSVDVASRAFLVKLDLPQAQTPLRPGAFARVGFRVGTEAHLVVPTTAVSTLGSLDRVFVVQGDTARLRMITLGEAQPPWIEVLSGLSHLVTGSPTPSEPHR